MSDRPRPGRAIRGAKPGAGGEGSQTPGRDAARAVSEQKKAERRAQFHPTTIRLHRDVTSQVSAWLADRPGETFTAMVLHALRQTYGFDIRDEHFPAKSYRVPRFKG